MKTKVEELKRILGNLEQERVRLAAIDRSLTSITDSELAFAQKIVSDRIIQLQTDIEKIDIST